ncbi:MD-2-related lipid-recognition protein-like [Artemia franciscana]|uniref:MD-2-related lipid-recognition protein-like n=1 Tax=Artemia franciscana TaxID=6661 RepID=UPI0032DB3092
MLKLLVFFTLWACACSEILRMYRPCGKAKTFGNGQLSEIRINPCPEALKNKPCVLKKDTNVSIEVDFTPNIKKKVVSLSSKAFWANKLVDMPLPNMNSNGCNFTTCPLENGKAATYAYNLNIAKSFPSRRYDVKWRFTGGGFNLCFLFPIVVQ